jgi:hypothetical protein
MAAPRPEHAHVSDRPTVALQLRCHDCHNDNDDPAGASPFDDDTIPASYTLFQDICFSVEFF